MKRRMYPRNMQPLNKIIRVDLPVRRKHHALGPRGHITLHRLQRQLRHGIPKLFQQAHRRPDRHKHQPPPLLDTDGLQRPIRHIKPRLLAIPALCTKPRRLQQHPGIAVLPLVIRTADRPTRPLALRQQPRPPMPAHIAKRPQHAVIAAHRKHLHPGNLDRHISPPRRQLRRRPQQLPRRREYSLPLGLKDLPPHINPRINVQHDKTLSFRSKYPS